MFPFASYLGAINTLLNAEIVIFLKICIFLRSSILSYGGMEFIGGGNSLPVELQSFVEGH